MGNCCGKEKTLEEWQKKMLNFLFLPGNSSSVLTSIPLRKFEAKSIEDFVQQIPTQISEQYFANDTEGNETFKRGDLVALTKADGNVIRTKFLQYNDPESATAQIQSGTGYLLCPPPGEDVPLYAIEDYKKYLKSFLPRAPQQNSRKAKAHSAQALETSGSARKKKKYQENAPSYAGEENEESKKRGNLEQQITHTDITEASQLKGGPENRVDLTVHCDHLKIRDLPPQPSKYLEPVENYDIDSYSKEKENSISTDENKSADQSTEREETEEAEKLTKHYEVNVSTEKRKSRSQNAIHNAKNRFDESQDQVAIEKLKDSPKDSFGTLETQRSREKNILHNGQTLPNEPFLENVDQNVVPQESRNESSTKKSGSPANSKKRLLNKSDSAQTADFVDIESSTSKSDCNTTEPCESFSKDFVGSKYSKQFPAKKNEDDRKREIEKQNNIIQVDNSKHFCDDHKETHNIEEKAIQEMQSNGKEKESTEERKFRNQNEDDHNNHEIEPAANKFQNQVSIPPPLSTKIHDSEDHKTSISYVQFGSPKKENTKDHSSKETFEENLKSNEKVDTPEQQTMEADNTKAILELGEQKNVEKPSSAPLDNCSQTDSQIKTDLYLQDRGSVTDPTTPAAQTLNATKTPRLTSKRSLSYESSSESENELPLKKQKEIGQSKEMQVNDIKNLCGYRKGIQWKSNSCYLDATLFSMFYCTNIFDKVTLEEKNSDPTATKVRKILRDAIVNPLRQNKYCSGENVNRLRKVLAHLNPKIQGAFMDAEELIFLLFDDVLKMKEFIKYSTDTEDFMHQIVPNPSDRAKCQSLQILFKNSLQMNGDLKLAAIPSPALLLEMPRSDGYLVQYEAIIPNLTLDISELMDTELKMCMCNQVATLDCKIQFENDAIAYCQDCEKISDVFHEDLDHFPKLEKIHLRSLKMHLMAVICIRSKHYTAFVRNGFEKTSPWLFFDSMAGPEVTEVANFGADLAQLEERPQGYATKSSTNSYLSNILTDSHICIYHSPTASTDE